MTNGTTPASGWKALVALAVTITLAGCQELLVEPASRGPADLGLSFALFSSEPVGEDTEAGSAAAAFDRADGVRVRLLRDGSSVVDVSQAFGAEGPETRIRLEVDVDGEGQTFQLQLTLTFQGAPLFQAARAVTLSPGETTEAEVFLQPVAAGVEVQDGPVTLLGIGSETQLEGVVLFATGDPIPGLALTWSTQDTDVLDVTSDGRVTARGAGEAQVVGSHQAFSGAVTVMVVSDTEAPTISNGQSGLIEPESESCVDSAGEVGERFRIYFEYTDPDGGVVDGLAAVLVDWRAVPTGQESFNERTVEADIRDGDEFSGAILMPWCAWFGETLERWDGSFRLRDADQNLSNPLVISLHRPESGGPPVAGAEGEGGTAAPTAAPMPLR